MYLVRDFEQKRH